MRLNTETQRLLDKIQELLPVTEDEVVQRGITETAIARIVELRQRAAQLAEHHGSLEHLEKQINSEGVPAEDHTLYTDLLEWRAVRHELSQLAGFLESGGLRTGKITT
ncbi:MAG: hypothetical protein P8Y14_23900 [Anaerolineales bacterium]|jgi:hypothetical protein